MDGVRILNDIKTRLTATGKSIHTFETYESQIKAFCLYFKDYHHPVHVPTKEIIKFLASIKKPSMARTSYYALKYLFKHIEKQPHKFDDLEPTRIKAKPRMPLSKDFILDKIEKIENKRDKALLSTLFSTGMRREELVKTKLEDIHWSGKFIVVTGKGNKTRLVPLPENLQTILLQYIVEWKPVYWLFCGEKAGHYLSPDTVLKKVQRYLKVSTHILRYSFGNSLRKAGVDLLKIRDLYGHSSMRTTEIYLKNDIDDLLSIYNPIDDLKKRGVEKAA